MTPTKPKAWPKTLSRVDSTPFRTRASPLTSVSRSPRATLRIAIANETELRKIADGKLAEPAGGFFNTRHAERFRMLQDFATNFQRQLVSTPVSTKASSSENPFNEKPRE